MALHGLATCRVWNADSSDIGAGPPAHPASNVERKMQALARMVRRIGPYLLMVFVVPGGMFAAVGLYFYRRDRNG